MLYGYVENIQKKWKFFIAFCLLVCLFVCLAVDVSFFDFLKCVKNKIKKQFFIQWCKGVAVKVESTNLSWGRATLDYSPRDSTPTIQAPILPLFLEASLCGEKVRSECQLVLIARCWVFQSALPPHAHLTFSFFFVLPPKREPFSVLTMVSSRHQWSNNLSMF